METEARQGTGSSALTVPSAPQASTRDLRSSVVKVFVRSVGPNFISPWAKRAQASATGSGVCISTSAGARYILTNSHVVAHAVSVRVRKHGDPTRYPVIVKCENPQCDLALLEVVAAEFWNGIAPIDLTPEVPQLDSRVAAVGYPMGGDNISITRGVVSRVDLMDYTFSPIGGERLPVIQVDAAINPGNSGGPVLNTAGKAIGVAFAGMSAADNIGYVIPGAVALFFIQNFVQSGRSTGLCSLGIRVQTTQSEALRRLHGLALTDGGQGLARSSEGVLIVAVAPLSPAAKAGVQEGDILLALDGIPIGEDASVPFRGAESNERIGFDFLVGRKVIGERVRLDLIASPATDKEDEASPSAPSRPRALSSLQTRSVDAVCATVPKLVSRLAGVDAVPTYFIVGGLVFIPLSLPWLQQRFPHGLSTAPGHLLQKLDSFRDHEEEEIVVLAKVLASEVNYGFEDFQCMQLHEVGCFDPASSSHEDMVKVRSLLHLRDFVNAARTSNQAGRCLRFMLYANFEVVLDIDACKAASAEILSQHAIPSECSANLLQQEDVPARQSRL